jgi:hypothetical protein
MAPVVRPLVHQFAEIHATHALRIGRLHSFTGQLAGLLHPSGKLSFVELVVLVVTAALQN